MKEGGSRPEVRKGRSEAVKKSWQVSPEKRKQRLARMHEACSRPDVRERMSATLRTVLGTPEARKRASERNKDKRANPETRKRMEAGRLKAAATLLGVEIARSSGPATKTDIWREGSALHVNEPDMSWPEIARRLTFHEFRAKGPRKAGESMRLGVTRYDLKAKKRG